jgi:cupin superfamily acireductone dioxygenase involved in methionine salvage
LMKKLETRSVFMRQGHVTQMHYHTYWELLYFLYGEGVLIVKAPQQEYSIAFDAGDAIMIPAGCDHTLTYSKPTNVVCIYGPLATGKSRGHLHQ